MPANRYAEIAFFLKTYGLKGELKMVLLDNIQFDISTLDSIFIKIKGQFIPYFIDYIQSDSKDLFVKLDDVNSIEAAAKLRGERVYIPSDQLEDITKEEGYDSLIGYTAFNQDNAIGKIDSLEAYPQQIMAVIDVNSKNVLIPLVDDFIARIDEEKMEIYFQLPEGLLDL